MVDPSAVPESSSRTGGQRLTLQRHWEAAQDVKIEEGAGGHGGGDALLLADVFRGPGEDWLERSSDWVDGVRSIAVGMAGNESLRTGLAGHHRRPRSRRGPRALMIGPVVSAAVARRPPAPTSALDGHVPPPSTIFGRGSPRLRERGTDDAVVVVRPLGRAGGARPRADRDGRAGFGGVEVAYVYPLGPATTEFMSDAFLADLRFAAGRAHELGCGST